MLSQKSVLILRPVSRLYATAALKKEENHKPVGWDEAKPCSEIPGPKPLPIIGNVFRFLPGGEFHKVQMQDVAGVLYKKYGKFVAFRKLMGRQEDVYFCFDPNDIETMFRNEGVWPHRRELESLPYYKEKVRDDVFQGVGGLLVSSGEKWAKFRTIVNPIMMQPRTTIQYTKTMDEIASEMIDLVKYLMKKNKQMPNDFMNVYNKWALESIAAVGLDTRLGCLNPDLPKDSPQMKYIKSVLEVFDLLHQLEIEPSPWRYISTPAWKRFVEVMDFITNTNLEYIEKAMKRLEEKQSSDHEPSVLEKLVKIDKKVALAMVMDLLQAGVDTTSRTLAAATYYLAKNPEKQTILREEAKKLLPSKDSPITKEILANAPYLKAVIKETTRIAPIATGNIRKTANDVVIQGYQVPKGVWLIASHLMLSHSEEHIKKPKEFIPERWLRSETNSEYSYKNIHPFVVLPFGFGPRSCIGKRLANLELEIALLKILRNFEMSWPHEDMPFAARLLYGIDGPLKVHLKDAEN